MGSTMGIKASKHIVSAALLLVTSYGVLADSNEYANPTVGFRITKPEAWQFATVQQNLDNLKSTKLQSTEMQEAMVRSATAPLVVMFKYPEPYQDINPSFKVNIKPLGQLKGRDAKQIAGLLLPSLQKAFKDFAVAQAPSDVTVSGLKGAYMRVTYSLEVPEVGLFPTTSELWIVPRGDYFFMIGAGTRTDEKTGSRQEIQDILKTISIER